MPYVWMNDVEKVQSVGPGGVAMVPNDAPVELDQMGPGGRGVVRGHSPYTIPNPLYAEDGDVIVAAGQTWNLNSEVNPDGGSDDGGGGSDDGGGGSDDGGGDDNNEELM